MGKALAIYRREVSFFFNSPMAYAAITVFILVSGYFFYNLLGYFNVVSIQMMQNPATAPKLNVTDGVMQPLFGNMSGILLLILPLLTMRLLCEERKTGTAELLFTFPISDWDAILGKYLAALTVFAAMLFLTILYPVILYKYTTPELGPILTGYIGLFLIGASFIAMGVFFSSLGENQLVAGVSTFGCGLLFILVGWISPFVSTTTATVLGQLSILQHFQNFSRGVLDTNDLIFYVNFTAFFLFLCSRVLESNHWRGRA